MQVFIHDTQGIDSSNYDIPRSLLGHSDAFLLIYALHDLESYNIIEQLKKDIDKNLFKKDVQFLIVGTKHLNKQRRVDASIAVSISFLTLILLQVFFVYFLKLVSFQVNWASREKVRHVEVSCMDRKSLMEPVQYIMNKIIQQQSKSTFGRPRLGARANTIANMD